MGRLSPSLGLEPQLRAELDRLLRPDPERAEQLRAHFQQGFRGIARRLWPRLSLVLAVDSGSNQIYGEMLRELYCQGVDLYSPFYAATEGRRDPPPGISCRSCHSLDGRILIRNKE